MNQWPNEAKFFVLVTLPFTASRDHALASRFKSHMLYEQPPGKVPLMGHSSTPHFAPSLPKTWSMHSALSQSQHPKLSQSPMPKCLDHFCGAGERI